TLVQALSITPDADSLQKAALKASAEATIDFHHARYVAQANNPLGFVEPGGDYIPDAGVSGDIVFMQDFFTGSWGYALAMDPPVSSTHKTRMQAFFQWNAQQVVGRLGAFGGATSWPYINAVQYRIACAPADTPDYAGGTGPWYSTFKQAYDATYASPPVWLGSTNGTLAGEAAPGNGAAASFWGNIQFSISYAVRHGVSGARDAYVRMASADNWPRLAADFVAAPVWAITPASGLLPSYMQGKAVGEFVAIPNSTLDASNGISGQWAFSNLALAIEEMLQDNSGGHNDGSLNIIRGFNLYTATGWVTRKGSTWAGEANMAYYADGSPAARHTYNTGWYSLARSRLMLHGSPVVAGGGAVSFPDSNGFNLANNTWDANNTWADAPDPGACQDADGNVWCAQGGPTNYIYKWNAVSDTWAQVRYHGGGANRPLTPMSDRPDKGYIFSCAVSGGALVAFKFNAGENTPITFNSSAAYSTYLAEAPENCTMRWDEVNRKFRIFGDKSNKIFEVTPNDTTVWDMAIATSTGATLPAPAAAMGRMAHIPAYRADVFAPGVNQPLYMRRYA
ncbi:MAG TPA: hypothetical protein PLL92_15290, partial [Alicycliphilus sp.]|nr:hypothetical protein [Alicycliphilus sp.]